MYEYTVIFLIFRLQCLTQLQIQPQIHSPISNPPTQQYQHLQRPLRFRVRAPIPKKTPAKS